MAHELSESVVDNKNIILGEGTFGIITAGQEKHKLGSFYSSSLVVIYL